MEFCGAGLSLSMAPSPVFHQDWAFFPTGIVHPMEGAMPWDQRLRIKVGNSVFPGISDCWKTPILGIFSSPGVSGSIPVEGLQFLGYLGSLIPFFHAPPLMGWPRAGFPGKWEFFPAFPSRTLEQRAALADFPNFSRQLFPTFPADIRRIHF